VRRGVPGAECLYAPCIRTREQIEDGGEGGGAEVGEFPDVERDPSSQ